MSPRPVAIVLSGGGAKTAAHLGAARAVGEAGLVPARYVATSMGAVMAAGLAAGIAGAALLERLTGIGRQGIVRDPLAVVSGLYTRSLLRPGPFRRAVEALVPARRFRDLSAPLTVAVVDLDTGELLLFGDGGEDAPLVDVLCATCALPLYFGPVRIDGRRCGDGGLRGVLPLEAAARVATEPVIAVDVGPGFDTPPGQAAAVPPVVRAHDDAVGTLMAALTAASVSAWRSDPNRPPLLYVRPPVERNATFQVDRMQQYAEDGYRAVQLHLTATPFGANSAT
ncbi:MAG TPA: patatin-like phospholipase family protein [Gemmatimonadales bacterium]|nr:patatin-like phospholipase family protein [Gemmatimonadales bacterium]